MTAATEVRSPKAILAAVAFAVFVAADDLTVVTTMLRPIINDLGLVLPDGLDEASWVVNAYLIAFVAVMPIAGRLSDVYGRRRVFTAAYLIFLVGTIVIPMSDTLGPFLIGRVLTAIGGGAMVPVALAVVGDVYPEARRARALGALAAIETLGWVWGPLYGAMLVRFFDWRLQFWLNIPLALGGLAWAWWALRDHAVADRTRTVDWTGAGLLTGALISLDVALLGNAEVQSVSGLDQLTGASGGPDFRWMYVIAIGLGWAFVTHQRTHPDPVIERGLLKGRAVKVALIVNFIVGAALVVAMVDVPILVNAVEIDLERSAVVAGWLLSAMTAGMAAMSYAGGRLAENSGARRPVLLGLGAAALAYAAMGLTWTASTSTPALAAMLALLGCGLGFTVAPTTSAVVDEADPDKRGAAASSVMVVRLLGLSVGLAALTAWALARFNSLRGEIDLPAITDPNFETALIGAQQSLTTDAIGETFLVTGMVTLVGLAIAVAMRPARAPLSPSIEETPMIQSLNRRLVFAASGLAVAMVVVAVTAFVWIGRLSDDLDETRTALVTTQDDLARVEAGSALFASQVQSFTDQLLDLQPTVSGGLDSAIDGLDTFAESTLEFNIAVDETVRIETDVVISRLVEVPIQTSIPINETIETTIRVGTPLGFDVPVDVSVPVNLDVPIDLVVDIPIDETVPVATDVPIKLNVPITVEVSETELAALAESLAQGLRSLQDILADLGTGAS
jgi:MFS family permease